MPPPRSYKKELLDLPGIPFSDIKRNMQELDLINRKLGGHAITIAGLKALMGDQPRRVPVHIVEIGCGGGDNLRAIGKWASAHQLSVHLTGIDINPECIAYAESNPAHTQISFICSDYRDADFVHGPDIIFSSLFCHHFTDEELVFLLQWMDRHCETGFFINDLHRHPLAYHSIKILTRLFSKSYLVKNDAPLSVQRGFIREDWKALFERAGLASFDCRWKWAFRWLIIYARHTTAI